MGIGIKNGDWTHVISKNLENDREDVAKGHAPHFPDGICNTDKNNIHTTEAADAFIAAYGRKMDTNGNCVAYTPRGLRRSAKRGR